MRIITFFILVAISFSSLALDEYSSASEGKKAFVKGIMKGLKIPESKDTEKKIYSTISYIFDYDTDWNSYWLGYEELSASKFKGEQDITYLEQSVNTSNNGVFFVSFLYSKKINQILVSRKQIRYGSKKVGLELFSILKEDKEQNTIRHEKDTYALVQKKEKVEYTAINMNDKSAVVVYFNQTTIDL